MIDASGTTLAEPEPDPSREKPPPLSRQNFMAQTKTSRVRFWLRSPLLLVWLAVQTADSAFAQGVPADPALIPSIFRPESTPAHAIHELSMLVLAITGAIFAVVFGLIAVRSRALSATDR